MNSTESESSFNIFDLAFKVYANNGPAIEYVKGKKLTDSSGLGPKVYNSHKEAIDLIVKLRPNLLTSVRGIVEDAVKEHAADLELAGSNLQYYFYLSSSLNQMNEVLETTDWVVVFEFRNEYRFNKGITLGLKVAPGAKDEATRERFRQLAQKGEPFRLSSRFGTQWGEIYSHPILGWEDNKSFNPQAAKPKVEAAIEEFYKRDYWRLVNAIRKEFELPEV